MAAVTCCICILAPAGIAGRFITVMNNSIDEMKHLKWFEGCLENALDQLCSAICDGDITRVRAAYKMLEDAKIKIEDAIINKECTMDETEAVLQELLTSNDVNVTTKAEIHECYQAYRSECEKEFQHIESHGSCSGEENDSQLS
ncbi:predicted protein [Histoplasma capsulatum G186AR]|uniref:Fungal N-terminal domain-containing protein n=1 Tax=Ajellomyces capsulatus (strain G186AR / H82 / ATCC MYA-2454 / RMSCC 2432) TaxID=447093 RepID=C0NVS5_AJECG|nr:uncharacterized protein HCBG_07255 [Histoplasma capsulatum G186AR]EEH04614.1 predicted protein [Histoplasma capsulatum G186AR]